MVKNPHITGIIQPEEGYRKLLAIPSDWKNARITSGSFSDDSFFQTIFPRVGLGS
jgi:hypothetical protein